MAQTNQIAVARLTGEVLKRHVAGLMALDEAIVRELGPRYDAHAWERPQFELALPGKWDLSVTALDRGSPVGFLIASRWDGNGHIHRFAVAKAHRGRGVGSMLLDAVTSNGRAEGLRYLTVQTPAANTEARDWYAGNGFSLCADPELAWYVHARGVEGQPKNGLLAQPEGDCWVLRLDLREPTARGRRAVEG